MDEHLEAGNSTPPIRILVNALHAKSGGGVTYLRNVLPRLARMPWLSLTLYLHPSQRALAEDLPGAVELRWAECRPGFLAVLAHEQLALPGIARRLGADVVFSPANFGPFFVAHSVTLLRNSFAVGHIERRLKQRLYWMFLSLATALSTLTARRVIAVSASAARDLTPPIGRLRDKVSVVHHGVSELFRPAAGGAPREDFLLAVGDIYVQKNYGTLLEAVALLAAHRPSLRLRVAGRAVDLAHEAGLMAKAAALGIAGNVEFLGQVEPGALAELYRRCRLFVFPSLVETFGNPLVEAMASGAPIACAEVSAMPEIAGDAALYFDPRDPRSMADVIARLFDDGALRDEMAGRGLQRARVFSWDRCAEETAAVLRAAARA